MQFLTYENHGKGSSSLRLKLVTQDSLLKDRVFHLIVILSVR
uniref:Uncharacterized protein n=1 Tax=Arundo donax TaxID=35708 RepID=A0A0A9B4A5_ARUDO